MQKFHYAGYAYFEELPLISSIQTKTFGRQIPKVYEIREALNTKTFEKVSQIQNRGDEPVQYMETTLGVFNIFQNFNTGNFMNI